MTYSIEKVKGAAHVVCSDKVVYVGPSCKGFTNGADCNSQKKILEPFVQKFDTGFMSSQNSTSRALLSSPFVVHVLISYGHMCIHGLHVLVSITTTAFGRVRYF